jgi:hypothetical protein
MTDHFLSRYEFPITDTTEFRSENFTTIIGTELHTDLAEFGDRWHILAVGLPNDFAPLGESEAAAQMENRAMNGFASVGRGGVLSMVSVFMIWI